MCCCTVFHQRVTFEAVFGSNTRFFPIAEETAVDPQLTNGVAGVVIDSTHSTLGSSQVRHLMSILDAVLKANVPCFFVQNRKRKNTVMLHRLYRRDLLSIDVCSCLLIGSVGHLPLTLYTNTRQEQHPQCPIGYRYRQYPPETHNLWRNMRQGLYTYLRDRLIRQIAIVERDIAQGEDRSSSLASDVTNRLKQSLLPSPTAIRPPSNRTMQDPVVQDQPYASAQGSHRDQYTPDIAQSSGRAVGTGDKGCKVVDQSPLSDVSQLPKESASSIHSADSPLQIEQSHSYPTSSKERRRKREKAAEAAGKPSLCARKRRLSKSTLTTVGRM